MAKELLVGCIPQITNSGDFYMTEDVEAIIQSIFVILVTPPNTRIWQPEFGSPILSYIFKPITTDTIAEIQSDVETVLKRWETRITINSVTVTKMETEKGFSIKINFKYSGRDYEHTFPFMEDVSLLDMTVYSFKLKKS